MPSGQGAARPHVAGLVWELLASAFDQTRGEVRLVDLAMRIGPRRASAYGQLAATTSGLGLADARRNQKGQS